MFVIDDLIGAVAAPLIGGLLGSGGKSSSQTQQSTIDPRIAEYLYGGGGKTGILPSAQDWYNQNKSGMSQPMTDSANAIWNQNNANHQGFDAMQGVGMGLLGGGVAGNPFAGGYKGGTDFSGGMGGNGGSINPSALSYTPPTRTMTTDPFKQAAAPAAVTPSPVTTIPPEIQAFIDGQKQKYRNYDQRDNLDPSIWQAFA